MPGMRALLIGGASATATKTGTNGCCAIARAGGAVRQRDPVTP